MDYIKTRNDLLGTTLVENFNKRFFESYYCSTKEEAKNKALSLIKEGSSVSWGGSMSIIECGLLDEIKGGNYKVIDRDSAKDLNERQDLMRQAFSADTFLMSANAVSQQGELVNIDGLGNRIAALCYGPEQVIVIAGLNKVAPDLDSAIKRARNVASPINTQRFNLDTPCTEKGACYDCKNPDCICAQMVITRISRPKNRIKIIFCGENLGF